MYQNTTFPNKINWMNLFGSTEKQLEDEIVFLTPYSVQSER